MSMAPLVTDNFLTELARALPTLTPAARALTQQSTLADDLVQETCRRAIEARATFTPGSNMRTWLLRILRNHFLDQVRDRKFEVPLSDHLDIVTAPEPEPVCLWRYIAAGDLRCAIAALPPKLREVYILHAVERLPYQVIARRLRMRLATVGIRLGRARIRLRQTLLRRIASESTRQSSGKQATSFARYPSLT